ncbi:hypothetical protein F5B18DRAFT_295936 [Nemania serpens]|nr:hypothetical protein F5B18DRAFT_295936 [Nemania serpens]
MLICLAITLASHCSCGFAQLTQENTSLEERPFVCPHTSDSAQRMALYTSRSQRAVIYPRLGRSNRSVSQRGRLPLSDAATVLIVVLRLFSHTAVPTHWISRLGRSSIHAASFTAVPAKSIVCGSDLLVSRGMLYHKLHVGPTSTWQFRKKNRRRHANLGVFECETRKAFVHALARLGGSTAGRCQLLVQTSSV